MNQSDFIAEVEMLGINVTSEKMEKLEKYYELIIQYNKIMNLTSITEKRDVYLKHFYDSLTISKIINLDNENSLCDLGSGAGFPGIVLKIFYPNLKIVLIDSLNKRITFLNKVIKELKLKDIYTIHTRIEDYARENKEKFDVVTARAVAPLNILLELGINLVKIGKYFIAMKGNVLNEPNFTNAVNVLNCSIENIIEFKLPIENSNRSLINIKKKGICPKIFPRKYSDIKRKPL